MPVLEPTAVAEGDVVSLRKPHPCGSFNWRVTGVGADVRLVCLGCGHRVLLPRSEFHKRLKQRPIPT